MTVSRRQRASQYGTVRAATEASVVQARTDKIISVSDEGAVAALLVLADKVDAMVQAEADVADAVERAQDGEGWGGDPPKPPPLDNVTLPTFLKYCEALGLTPTGRKALVEKKQGGAGGKLALLRADQGAAAS